MNDQTNLTKEQALRWEVIQHLSGKIDPSAAPNALKATVNRLTELVLTGDYQTPDYRSPSASTERTD